MSFSITCTIKVFAHIVFWGRVINYLTRVFINLSSPCLLILKMMMGSS